MSQPVPVISVHVWGVPPGRVPAALGRMATHPRLLRRGPDAPAFARLLGTGSGFRVADADPTHWALVAAWPSAPAADAFEHGPVARSWRRIAREELVLRLRPVSSRGSWGGQAPFDGVRPDGDLPDPPDPPDPQPGPVAALTRARIRPGRLREFWRAAAAVQRDLAGAAGLRLALGIGEAPVGFQGTLSVWDSAAALRDFAYDRAAHAQVIEARARRGWYAEELFARFTVLDLRGTYRGRTP